MKIAFQPILHLEIWHDYLLGQSEALEKLPAQYDISEVISLIPTLECQKILRNLRWVFRPQPYGAVLLAHVRDGSDGDGATPIVPIDPSARLTFWLVIRDRNFHNYTNLPLTKPRQHLYYFSNITNNQPREGAPLFLTQPLTSYQAQDEYQFGHLVAYNDAQGDFTLEASKYQAPADDETAPPNDSPDLDDTDGNWISLPSSQYVSGQDHVPTQGLSRSYLIPAADSGQRWQFSLKDVNEKNPFSLTLKIPDDHLANGQVPVNLNFSGQQPGYYKLQLNGDPVDEFVLFDPMAARNVFALVELSLNPALLSPAFQLLQGQVENLKLHKKTYQIRFKNRSTFWRYHCSRPHGFTADSLRPNLQLIDNTTYVTQNPLGLCRQPKRPLVDGNKKPLPVPSLAMITPEIEKKSSPDDDKLKVKAIFSDIYL